MSPSFSDPAWNRIWDEKSEITHCYNVPFQTCYQTLQRCP